MALPPRTISAHSRPDPSSPPTRADRGFTLIEMLVVVGIILAMMALLVPAFNGIKTGSDVNSIAYEIKSTLDQARAYAMANGTYVYVGLEEVDASIAENKVPQNAATGTAGGRIAIAVVTTKDGSRGYALSDNLANPAWQTGTTFVALSNLVRIDNMHLAASVPNPTSGGMSRPAVDPAQPECQLGSDGAKSSTPFSWPLGAQPLNAGAQYTFNKVIQFDPQGTARIQLATNSDSIDRYLEIGLQPTHGSLVPPAVAGDGTTGSQAVVQIDGMTGSTRVFRP